MIGEKTFKVNDFYIDKRPRVPYNIKATDFAAAALSREKTGIKGAERFFMRLDLSRIIEVPGASVSFETALDGSLLRNASILDFPVPPTAEGTIRNTAGVLDLHAVTRARMKCVCDRCGREFERDWLQTVDVPLVADLSDDADSDAFPIEDNGVDVNEVLETCFILESESKTLCREDCKGLCPVCGKDLNDGPCGCETPKDPRFAVLEQLLDK